MELMKLTQKTFSMPEGTEERFYGFGLMGMTFNSGYIRALRHFPEQQKAGYWFKFFFAYSILFQATIAFIPVSINNFLVALTPAYSLSLYPSYSIPT